MATLTCSTCGSSSPAGKRFCGECGAAFPRICPNCEAAVPEAVKFCPDCGSILPEAPHASSPSVAPVTPEEERRLVTVLFCDLVGSTPLAEKLDTEDVRDVLAVYFEAMEKHITRYGGSVEKYAGDAVLALFGLPSAHEDDAERAVLCGLAMQEAIQPVADSVRERYGVELTIRVGADTGEVVSGGWAASGRQGEAVTGDAVNTAARIQAVADPGGVLVGEETMRLTRRRIVYGNEQSLTLKGKTDLVSVYAAIGLREEIGERWENLGQATPLVGRQREMRDILDAWELAAAGEGQLITVIGDPGVGKSRLLAEAVHQIQQATASVRPLRGRCLSYGQSISLWLIADLLRGFLDLQEDDPPDTIREHITNTLTALLQSSDIEDEREAIDVLGEVLGLPAGDSMVAQAGPQIRRAALVRSLRRVLGVLSERSPLVLLLEDLHWVDQASQEVIAEVVVDVPGLPVLVLAAQRQGWTAPWSQWGWTERLTLRPLGETDAALLAGSILTGLPPSSELLAYLADRAGGNPFFVEELIRALQEADGLEAQDGELSLKGTAAERLPVTLTEVVQARLDRLDTQVKGVAQVGSVIGRSFAVRLLAQVMERQQAALELPLTGLQQAELAFPRRSAELEYVFKHVTVQEVAYGMLVRKRKKDLHLRTARAIAALYPSDEYVEIIAYHYARTDEPEAAEWLEKAGDRAAAIYATDIALSHYREAAKRLEAYASQEGASGVDPALARIAEKAGGVLHAAGRYDEAFSELKWAVELFRHEGDNGGVGRVTARMGMAHRYRGTPEEGIALVQPMANLLARDEPSSARASLHIALATLYFLVGRYREQEEEAGQAAAIARAIGDMRLLGEAEERRGQALINVGHQEAALGVIEGAIPLIEAGGDLDVLRRALDDAGMACQNLGEREMMHAYMERSLSVAERLGNPDSIAFSLANLGSILTDSGEWAMARLHLERAMALVEDRRTPHGSYALTSFGSLSLREGKWEEAGQLLAEALAISEETNFRRGREDAQAGLAELDIEAGRPEQAIRRLEGLTAEEDAGPDLYPTFAWACLEAGATERAAHVIGETVERARMGGNTLHLRWALHVQGMVFIRQHQWAEAEKAVTEALEMARVRMDPYQEGRALHQMAQMWIERGDVEEARPWLQQALAIFRRLGAMKDIERAEEAIQKLS